MDDEYETVKPVVIGIDDGFEEDEIYSDPNALTPESKYATDGADDFDATDNYGGNDIVEDSVDDYDDYSTYQHPPNSYLQEEDEPDPFAAPNEQPKQQQQQQPSLHRVDTTSSLGVERTYSNNDFNNNAIGSPSSSVQISSNSSQMSSMRASRAAPAPPPRAGMSPTHVD